MTAMHPEPRSTGSARVVSIGGPVSLKPHRVSLYLEDEDGQGVWWELDEDYAEVLARDMPKALEQARRGHVGMSEA